MKDKKTISFDMVKGELKKNKKVQYEWETKPKYGIEPWHFSTATLIIDILILAMYLFVEKGIHLQIPIGYGGLILSVLGIIISYILLKTKSWSIGVTRYTNLINIVAICITSILLGLTLLITPY